MSTDMPVPPPTSPTSPMSPGSPATNMSAAATAATAAPTNAADVVKWADSESIPELPPHEIEKLIAGLDKDTVMNVLKGLALVSGVALGIFTGAGHMGGVAAISQNVANIGLISSGGVLAVTLVVAGGTGGLEDMKTVLIVATSSFAGGLALGAVGNLIWGTPDVTQVFVGFFGGVGSAMVTPHIVRTKFSAKQLKQLEAAKSRRAAELYGISPTEQNKATAALVKARESSLESRFPEQSTTAKAVTGTAQHTSPPPAESTAPVVPVTQPASPPTTDKPEKPATTPPTTEATVPPPPTQPPPT